VDLIGRAMETKGAMKRCIASFANDGCDSRPSHTFSGTVRAYEYESASA
jgi:hypothetical protein